MPETNKFKIERLLRNAPRSICPKCGLPNDGGESLEWCTCEDFDTENDRKSVMCDDCKRLVAEQKGKYMNIMGYEPFFLCFECIRKSAWED
jgi:hypothetical protein